MPWMKMKMKMKKISCRGGLAEHDRRPKPRRRRNSQMSGHRLNRQNRRLRSSWCGARGYMRHSELECRQNGPAGALYTKKRCNPLRSAAARGGTGRYQATHAGTIDWWIWQRSWSLLQLHRSGRNHRRTGSANQDCPRTDCLGRLIPANSLRRDNTAVCARLRWQGSLAAQWSLRRLRLHAIA